MVSLFRSTSHDLETLRSTVCTLRETTVPGLAAALSWRSRKVEKLLIQELTRPGTAMAYDPARRVVRWVPVTSTLWQPTAPTAAPPPPPPPAPARPKVDLGPALSAPPPVMKGGGLKSQCPSCHVPLAASTSPSLTVCPRCGRLFSPRNAPSNPSPPVPEAAPPSAAPPVASGRAPAPMDRRSQELLAAYMTAKPIPCPRCRTVLRHRGLSEYGCPSCGEVVRFRSNSVEVTDRPSAAAALTPGAR